MTSKPLKLDVFRAGRLGWCLSINGTPYAHGTLHYCCEVAATVRRDFARHGWGAFLEFASQNGGAA